MVRFRQDDCTVGNAFVGLDVGIEVVDAMHVRFWLHGLDLGLFETIPAVDTACFEQRVPRKRSRVRTAA